jgi:predicted transcriptional regulator
MNTRTRKKGTKNRRNEGAFTGMLKKMKDEIELLSRHIDVARAVVDHQPIGIMKLSELLALPSHRIRYSLHVLEQMGYIRASPDGAVATPQASRMFADLDNDLEDLVGMLTAMKKKDP